MRIHTEFARRPSASYPCCYAHRPITVGNLRQWPGRMLAHRQDIGQNLASGETHWSTHFRQAHTGIPGQRLKCILESEAAIFDPVIKAAEHSGRVPSSTLLADLQILRPQIGNVRP